MRIEHDFLGPVEVPDTAYYGSLTARALSVFRISDLRWQPEFIRAIATLKLACALANAGLGVLSAQQRDAIVAACREILAGKFDHEFQLDVFQAGAGTPFNMNANEVIANRAEELLGGMRGEYRLVHPNDHINASQSTNDVIPSVIRIAALELSEGLERELDALAAAFAQQAEQSRHILKVGRTHLQDAVPLSFASAFLAYREYLVRGRKKLQHACTHLTELAIGGTALGSGITAPKGFSEKTVEQLNQLTGEHFTVTHSKIYLTQSYEAFLELSHALKFLSLALQKIVTDIIHMASGPFAGFNELLLPEIEPGSSIMPGKVNPSVPECVRMVAYQVEGNCKTIERCFTAEFELNTNSPVVAHTLASAIGILTNALRLLREHCIAGLRINEEKVAEDFHRSTVLATAFSPLLGYKKVAEIVREAVKRKAKFLDVLREKQLLPEEDIQKILKDIPS